MPHAEPSRLPAFPENGAELPAICPQLAQLGYSLRKLHLGDTPWLRSLYASTRAEEMAKAPWADDIKRAFIDHQFDLQHQHYISHFTAAIFLAIEHPAMGPVGRLYLQCTAPEHLLIDICLLPPIRRQGVGSALVRLCQRQAAALGHRLELHVEHRNLAAQRLYQRLGFHNAEKGDSHWLMIWPGVGNPVVESTEAIA